MELRLTILRVLFCAEALLFLPGLPAWGRLADASAATQAYLLCLGVFSAMAFRAAITGKPSSRFWAWGTAITNLPVYPALTPVGVVLAGLLISLEPKAVDPGKWRHGLWGTVKRPHWYAWAATLAFCWVGASEVHRFAITSSLPEVPALLLFGGLWLTMPLCVLAHRVGHRLAGKYVGLAETHGWSGWADPQPAAITEGDISGRLIVWALGGPAASLALGALLIGILALCPGTSWAGIGQLAGLAAVCSLAIFFVSIMPWTAAGHRSDGELLRIVLTGAEAFRRERALALLSGSWLRGVRPRDWDPAHLRVIAGIADQSRQHATACALNYLYCLDHDYDASARYWIGRLASEYADCPALIPVRWRMEIAFFLAAYDNSARSRDACHWRAAAGSAPSVPHSMLLRSEAALALGRGEAGRCATLIDAAERAALGAGPAEGPEFELELLGRLRTRIAPVTADDSSSPGQVETSAALNLQATV